jgi:hypothetical protein
MTMPRNGRPKHQQSRDGGGRYSADSTRLEESLVSGNPSILELPGHFVAARGKTGSDFLINDPASEISLLANLENIYDNYSSINSYVPTKTDLSYIMLVINSGIDFSLSDEQGNPVNATVYVQEPLINNLNSFQTSGEKLQVLIFPEPQIGAYYITINGKETFQLDAYMYDQEGNLIGGKYETMSENIIGANTTIIQFIYNYNSITYSSGDDDNDGVIIGDYCPKTTCDIFDPLGTNRWEWSENGWHAQTPRGKGKAYGPQISFNMTDTFGCSCKQILDILEKDTLEKLRGHRKYGCSKSILERFIYDMGQNELDY